MTSTLYYTLQAEQQQEWLSTQLVPGQGAIFVSIFYSYFIQPQASFKSKNSFCN